jgi:hypothetical protein
MQHVHAASSKSMPPNKVSLPLLRGFCWRQRLIDRRLLGAASSGYVALDFCYLSWLKIGSPAGWRARARCHYPSGNIAVRWQIAGLPPYLVSLDYGTWGVVQPKRKAMLTQKWAFWSELFGNCGLPKLGDVAEKLPHAQTAHRKGHRHWQWQ